MVHGAVNVKKKIRAKFGSGKASVRHWHWARYYVTKQREGDLICIKIVFHAKGTVRAVAPIQWTGGRSVQLEGSEWQEIKPAREEELLMPCLAQSWEYVFTAVASIWIIWTGKVTESVWLSIQSHARRNPSAAWGASASIMVCCKMLNAIFAFCPFCQSKNPLQISFGY